MLVFILSFITTLWSLFKAFVDALRTPTRIHFIELHDLEFFPVFGRNYVTDYLSAFWRLDPEATLSRTPLGKLFRVPLASFFRRLDKVGIRPPYRIVSELLADALRQNKSSQVVDLCSGGSGPVLLVSEHINRALGFPCKFVLTDLYPNIPAFEVAHKADPAHIHFEPKSVNAMNCHIKGFRTMFMSFHHFRPEEASQIIADAVAKGQGIAIFENTSQSWLQILQYSLLLWPLIIVSFPLATSASIPLFFFTFVCPIIPLVLWFDGVISHLRTYSKMEYMDLISRIPNSDQFQWKTGRECIVVPFMHLEYLIGFPKNVK